MSKKATPPAIPAVMSAFFVLFPLDFIILEYTQAAKPAPSKNPISALDILKL